MRVSIVPAEVPAEIGARARPADRYLRRLVFRRLRDMTRGRLAIHDTDGEHDFGVVGSEADPTARVYIYHARVYSRIA